MMQIVRALNSATLKSLSWPLILLSVSVLISAGIYIFVQSVSVQAAARAEVLSEQLNGLHNSIADIAQEESTIVQFIDQYQVIVDSGRLLAEDRLQLLQTLDNLRIEMGLENMSVGIDNQQRTDLRNHFSLHDAPRPFYLTSSQLNLKFSLLHEQDLIRFLSALQQASSLSIVDQCTLTESADQAGTLARFAAECKITWITFDVEGLLMETMPDAV